MPKRNKQSKPGEPRKKVDLKNSVSFNEHEDDQLCSTSYCDRALIIKPKDIKQKMMIAANVVIACREEKKRIKEGKKYPDVLGQLVFKRLNEYTSIPCAELNQINDSVRTRDRSFEKAFKDTKAIPYPTLGFISDDLRTILFKCIVEQRHFPSKMDVLKELKTLASTYTNETLPIQRLVRNKLIKYEHFPEFNRYLLTEHPENVYQRTLYLNNITELRSQERNFVYVEVRRISPRSTTSGFIAGLAAFPNSGKLEKFFTKDSSEIIAKKWLQQRILPLIEEGSVAVLSQPKKRKNMTSNKRLNIIKWLDDNGIPYGSNPHTAELYSLYKTFKAKVKQTGLYDHVFMNAGFDVILCPPEWRKLNFFNEVWTQIEVMDSFHTGRPEAMKQKILNATQKLTTLDKTEESLIEEEFKMLKEDRKMEEIVENVREMVKKGEVKLVDFPKECCGDKTDYLEMHVSDIVIDVT